MYIIIYIRKPRMFVNFYSSFTLLLEFMITSSLIEKSLHKSFQTANNFFLGLDANIRLQLISFTINFSLNFYIRLPINKAAAAVCQLLPTAISGSRLCAVFCQWHKYSGKLGQKQHKIDENSSFVFKWQILVKESTI